VRNNGTPSTNDIQNPTEQVEAPVPTETVSMSNGPNMKDEAPIPTEPVSMSNGPNIMQGPPTPTGQDEASIPSETVSNDSDMNRTVTNSRKAAKRSLPWDLKAGELLVSQDEDNLARKKPRLEEPLPTTDEAARKTASPDISVGLPPPAVDNDDVDAKADPVTDAQPSAGASTRSTGSWTQEEDAKLTRALANTYKKRWGKKYVTDWVAVSALVLGRTKMQCLYRWKDALGPSNDRASERKGKWTEDEDIKLKAAVQTHGGKNWAAIAVLVPGRTRSQCLTRWHHALNPTIDRANERTGKWAEDEDSKLKDTVQTHDGKEQGTPSKAPALGQEPPSP
jgi:hypothetical protein